MPLESLLELVAALRGRIDEHGTALRQNEMRTRYALIDPLLRELGWDTSDPSDVMIEDGSGDGRADYLLLDNDQPVMIIEAKRLGLGVSDGRQQAVNYAMDQGRRARYFAVTDGSRWEIYDTHLPAISMLIVSFSLTEEVPAEVCLKALALWKSSAIEGKVIAAETPLLESTPRVRNDATERHSNVYSMAPSSQNGGKWMRLSDFSENLTQLGRQVSELKDTYGEKPLSEIEFPDNGRTSLEDWKDLTVEVVRWLTQGGYLTETHCPINVSQSTRSQSIVTTRPVHQNGNHFKEGAYEKITYGSGNDVYVFTGFSAHIQIKRCVQVIKRVRSSAISQFKVRLSS